ncbi:methyltransferase domain-containing protein [Shimazuella sp. AN120528]|uniref:methyltransferase domain-containing protein n=1 Tax=Shimazuella soli TaxID=1892854 RepID=UPI001F0E2428|nr:methyltransferase domain-containing protein [Shimazuella soli]MCH5586714.1 methyltransferase domain-containing protein [Shimazuella soli]
MKVIYPPTIHWEGSLVFQRPQQLMKAFAKLGHRAVFMEYGRYDGTVYYRDGVEISDCCSILPKAEESTVLWVTHPPYYRMKDTFHADLVVFDYIDEAAEEFAVWNNPDLQKAMETADVITVVSQRLYHIVKQLFSEKPLILMPNAADFEHFCDAKKMSAPLELQHIPKPILGFMGSIASWIDVSIMKEVANQRPDWSIVLLGNDYIGVESIFGDCPNVYFLGRKLYHELPSYVGQFAVGMVPFQVRDMTHSSSPIKMYEYLAAGVPVISTPIQEAIDCPYVATGANATEWVKEIEHIISGNPEELQSFALQESWEARVKQIEPILADLAENKDRKKVYRRETFAPTTSTYWDIRFLTDWENLGGRNQTSFFANVIVDYLPEYIKKEIQNSSYQLCDVGCALGDAIPVYSKAFPLSTVEGIDFSTEAVNRARISYPEYTFQVESIDNMTNEYDIILCSNVLALYTNPIVSLEKLMKKAKHYIVLLLPYQAEQQTQENQAIFTFDSFPDSIGQFQLTTLEEIDCGKIPQSYCQSKQVLVVYKK